MRIAGPASPKDSATARPSSTGDGKGVFRVDLSSGGTREAKPMTAAYGVDALQGLMALQEESEPARVRRQKAAKRGFALLDALGALKAGLLAGKADAAALQALRFGLDEAHAADPDAALKPILNAIDVRAAVELAKLGR